MRDQPGWGRDEAGSARERLQVLWKATGGPGRGTVPSPPALRNRDTACRRVPICLTARGGGKFEQKGGAFYGVLNNRSSTKSPRKPSSNKIVRTSSGFISGRTAAWRSFIARCVPAQAEPTSVAILSQYRITAFLQLRSPFWLLRICYTAAGVSRELRPKDDEFHAARRRALQSAPISNPVITENWICATDRMKSASLAAHGGVVAGARASILGRGSEPRISILVRSLKACAPNE